MKYLIPIILFLVACKPQEIPPQKEPPGIHLEHVPTFNADSTINVLIEIPAGSTEKWEYDKEERKMKIDSVAGQPRIINYLGYPANYGMIPHTQSAALIGGDGDPLDVLVIGPSLDRPSIVKCKILGVLKLQDDGETDDKLIGATNSHPLALLSDLSEIDSIYPGMLDIIETWFVNYKGVNENGQPRIESLGYQPKAEAIRILNASKIKPN